MDELNWIEETPESDAIVGAAEYVGIHPQTLQAAINMWKRHSPSWLECTQQPTGWRPIAEHDGSSRYVIVATKDWVSEAYYDSERDEWNEPNHHWTDSWGNNLYPTHFMPLPKAPQPPRGDE